MRYTSSEAMEQIMERRNRLRKRREQRRLGWISVSLCAVVLVLTLAVSSAPVSPREGAGTAAMGSFLLDAGTGGIIASVVLAFLLGVLITLLCIRNRASRENRENFKDSQNVKNGGKPS